MPNHKLQYFNATGRGELIRLLFAYSGINFEDHRVKLEEWPTTKPTTPLGTLPFLEVDKTILVCSIPCARYVAAEGNLLGLNNLERAQADGIVDLVADLISAFGPINFLPENEKQAALDKFYNGLGLNTAKQFEKLIGWYGSNGHSVGSNTTWADIALFRANSFLKALPNFNTEYPKLNAVADKVAQNERIQNYLKTREPLFINF